eukprot:m.192935 g.192935  ORF g.192935 m.192935 type:complete len:278 (-) comp10601_c1_seq1:187-1020(-)
MERYQCTSASAGRGVNQRPSARRCVASESAALKAAMAGAAAVLASILDSGDSEVDAADRFGYSLLHWAARMGHAGVVEVLLSRGANPASRCKFGRSILHDVAHSNSISVLEQLTACHGVDLDERDAHVGDTALHYAAANSAVDVMALLLALGCSIHTTNNYGETPLHKAVRFCQGDSISFLIARGASLTACCKLGFSALANASPEALAHIELALADWSVDRHQLFGPHCAEVVVATLLSARRCGLALPTELWWHVFSFLRRCDFIFVRGAGNTVAAP